MKLIIDSNIVFSALLNSNSKIGELILQGGNYFEFFTIYQLEDEILNHKDKVLKHSKISEQQFNIRFNLLIKNINFIVLERIETNYLLEAFKLVKDIDENDAIFVALSMKFGFKLWTGDKKLINGLRKKGFNQIIETQELFNLYISRN